MNTNDLTIEDFGPMNRGGCARFAVVRRGRKTVGRIEEVRGADMSLSTGDIGPTRVICYRWSAVPGGLTDAEFKRRAGKRSVLVGPRASPADSLRAMKRLVHAAHEPEPVEAGEDAAASVMPVLRWRR